MAEEEIAFVRAYQEAGEREKQASKDKGEAKSHLLHAMGEAGLARLNDGSFLTRKEISRKGYVVEPTTYVDFRIHKPKGKK
jgi:hypothetical protein